MLAVITNDAWFGKTSAAFQHYDMAVMRAVENRVFVVRAANTGVSGMIDPLGRSVKKTGIFTEEVFTVDAGLRKWPSYLLCKLRHAYAGLFRFFSPLPSSSLGPSVRR